jgi:hypothetical protein
MSSGVVSDLIARGTRVWWRCEECRAAGPADLPAILAARGPDYDLTDRTAPCRTAGCGYWVTFYAQDGQRTSPLRTERGLMRLMDRRTAWLRTAWAASARPAG